jgi:hypothetical protein
MSQAGGAGRLPARWVVRGNPVGYSSGAAEQQWKAQITAVVPAAPGSHAGTGLFAGFDMPAPTSRAPGADLDNLLDPAMSAVINGRGWFGGRRPNVAWVAAQKKTAPEPGAVLAVLDQVPELWEEPDALVAFDDVYRGVLRGAGAVEEYAAWIERGRMHRLVSGKVGVRLDFADARVNLGEVATGAIKALIDGLWPVLGGRRGAPDDRRVAALVMRKGIADLAGTVAVKVVGLPAGYGADS